MCLLQICFFFAEITEVHSFRAIKRPNFAILIINSLLLNGLRRISLFLIPLLMTLMGKAQLPAYSGSNLRHKTFATAADSISLDTTSIIPQTFTVEGIPSSDYRLDFRSEERRVGKECGSWWSRDHYK